MSWQCLKDFHEYFQTNPQIFGFYKLDHQAFTKWDDEPSVNIVCAYWVYKRALANHSGKVILGGGSLRNDMKMIREFGLLSGCGIQDPEVAKWVRVQQAIEKMRAAKNFPVRLPIAKPQSPALNLNSAASMLMGDQARPSPFKPQVQARYGAILSDKSWSPLVNDSLILGAIHGRRQFDLHKPASAPAAAPPAQAPGKVAQLRAGFEIRGPQKTWLDYFKQDKEVLWNANETIPRVLSRELLGLQAFGYLPQFEESQLTFIPGTGKVDATFFRYRQALHAAGLFSGDAKAPQAAISNYLFGNPALLN